MTSTVKIEEHLKFSSQKPQDISTQYVHVHACRNCICHYHLLAIHFTASVSFTCLHKVLWAWTLSHCTQEKPSTKTGPWL